MKNTIKTLAVSIFILMGLYSISSSAQTVGEAGPDFEVTKLDGDKFKLSDQKGKVVFVFLFGNNCPHCVANGPNTETEIFEVFKSNPSFMAIGIDTWDGNSSSVTRFAQRTGITYPLALKGSAVASSYSTTYDRILVFDTDGILLHKSTANAIASVVQSARDVIETSLGKISGIFNLEQTKISLNAYPNPTDDILYIDNPFENEENVLIRIHDLSGRLAYEAKLLYPGSRISLSTQNLAQGNYILQMNNFKSVANKKIIVYR